MRGTNTSQGAAAVLEFYAIESPLSQPRNAILGQLLSSIVGVGISKLFALGPVSEELAWLGGSLACACAVAVMALTGTIHPPAGATALLAVMDAGVVRLGWFIIPVVLLDCMLMQCVALALNNIQRRFPVYWWTPSEVGCREKQQQQHDDGERSGSYDGSEAGAKFQITKARHLEEGRVVMEEESKVIIKRGQVFIPEDVYISPEERIFLEKLSERL